MTVPICWCDIVSQNETDESAETAMNVSLLARAIHMGMLLL